MFNRKLFNKTIAELEAPQLKIIEAEEKRLLARALREANAYITRANAMAAAELREEEARERARIVQELEQEESARRESDRRLRETCLDLAERECSQPGSVTQAELDALPKAHDNDFVAAPPDGAPGCKSMIFRLILSGESAFILEFNSKPRPAVIVAQAYQAPIPTATFTIPFNSALSSLREYAVSACATRGNISIPRDRMAPTPPYTFSPSLERTVADGMISGLGHCERMLFERLIEVIQDGRGAYITAQWVKETVESYDEKPAEQPAYIPPDGEATAPPRGEPAPPTCSVEGGMMGCPTK